MNYFAFEPDSVKFYLFEKQVSDLALFQAMGNVSSYSNDVRELQRLLSEIRLIIKDRKTLFEQIEVDNFMHYNKLTNSANALPRIIVFINDFDLFYPEANELKFNLIALLEEGVGYGVNFLVSVNIIDNFIENQFLQCFTHKIGLKNVDSSCSIKLTKSLLLEELEGNRDYYLISDRVDQVIEYLKMPVITRNEINKIIQYILK